MRILREPLLHFLVLGAFVYLAAHHFEADSARYRIDAGAGQRARLEATYREQYGVAPTAEQLQQLLDQYVRSEILYREGLAMGLERDDEIVRRRVVQKIEFVNEDLDTQAEPESSELVGFFERHRDRYSTAPTVSFRQIFFSSDKGGQAAAKARAEAILLSLERGVRDATVASGDTFAVGAEFSSLSRVGADGVFGDSELSAALFSGPAGRWTGPHRSAYGWHLVYIVGRRAAQPAMFDAVRARVRADYLADLRDQRNGLAFRRIASKYRIVRNEPSA
jgi:peptidyl-prolyl cis-trans isomerase C